MTDDGNAAQDERPAVADIAAGALRASEQQLEREFGRVPTGWVMISLAAGRRGLYLAVNDAYCELTGYSLGELDGRDFLGDVHAEDQAALETLIQDVISGETSLIRTDARLVRKDGEIVYGRLTGAAIRPAAGEVTWRSSPKTLRRPNRRGPRYVGSGASYSDRGAWRAWGSWSAESRTTSATCSR